MKPVSSCADTDTAPATPRKSLTPWYGGATKPWHGLAAKYLALVGPSRGTVFVTERRAATRLDNGDVLLSRRGYTRRTPFRSSALGAGSSSRGMRLSLEMDFRCARNDDKRHAFTGIREDRSATESEFSENSDATIAKQSCNLPSISIYLNASIESTVGIQLDMDKQFLPRHENF